MTDFKIPNPMDIVEGLAMIGCVLVCIIAILIGIIIFLLLQ